MSQNITQSVVRALRDRYQKETKNDLLYSHAYELLAAVLGYGSYASMKSEHDEVFISLEKVDVIIPDLKSIADRASLILKQNLTSADAAILCGWIEEIVSLDREYPFNRECIFNGQFWTTDDLRTYFLENHIDSLDGELMELLSGEISEANSAFEHPPLVEEVEVVNYLNRIEFSFEGTYEGTNREDIDFPGRNVNFSAVYSLTKSTVPYGFGKPNLEGEGEVDYE